MTMPAKLPTEADLKVETLGACRVPSPLGLATTPGVGGGYTPDDVRVALTVESVPGEAPGPSGFEKAGPRARIYFDPAHTRAAIVTCGGLSPGINNVIRSMVLELHHKYGVAEVLGYRYGYEGLDPAAGLAPLRLGPDEVRWIHKQGGSILGLSRGAHDPVAMIDTLRRHRVDILFAIGGDGTLRGAHALHAEAVRQGLHLAVVGVPKTVDNDVPWVDKTFGFDTAVELARLAVDAAHAEATSSRNGVGLVKVMGRDAGFIAAAATLATTDVNYCLVPEVPFALNGPGGLLAAMEHRLAARGHAVVVVAEGAGASLSGASPGGPGAPRDASGNVRYASDGLDVGPVLRDAILARFRATGTPISVKYIDPSYMIRSVPANAGDSIYCDSLARHAVHAGMSGRTGIVVGRWHRAFTHLPLALVTATRKRIDPNGDYWLAVTQNTGQPALV